MSCLKLALRLGDDVDLRRLLARSLRFIASAGLR